MSLLLMAGAGTEQHGMMMLALIALTVAGMILWGIGWLIYMAGLGIYKVGKEAYYRYHPEKRPEMKGKLAEQAKGMGKTTNSQKEVAQPKEAKRAIPLASVKETKPAQQGSKESSPALGIAERTRAESSAASTSKTSEKSDLASKSKKGVQSIKQEPKKSSPALGIAERTRAESSAASTSKTSEKSDLASKSKKGVQSIKQEPKKSSPALGIAERTRAESSAASTSKTSEKSDLTSKSQERVQSTQHDSKESSTTAQNNSMQEKKQAAGSMPSNIIGAQSSSTQHGPSVGAGKARNAVGAEEKARNTLALLKQVMTQIRTLPM